MTSFFVDIVEARELRIEVFGPTYGFVAGPFEWPTLPEASVFWTELAIRVFNLLFTYSMTDDAIRKLVSVIHVRIIEVDHEKQTYKVLKSESLFTIIQRMTLN